MQKANEMEMKVLGPADKVPARGTVTSHGHGLCPAGPAAPACGPGRPWRRAGTLSLEKQLWIRSALAVEAFWEVHQQK